MRQIFLTEPLEHTPTQLVYKNAKFTFQRVSENLEDLLQPISYRDVQLLVFGADAQAVADYLLQRQNEGNLKVKAAEIESSRLRDLCQDHFEYCRDIEDLKQVEMTPESFKSICQRRTTTKNGIVSPKLSRVYEIRRCCYNADCKQTHGSLRAIVVGTDDIEALKDFAGQHKGKLREFFNDETFDVCACVGSHNIDSCMEILFMLG